MDDARAREVNMRPCVLVVRAGTGIVRVRVRMCEYPDYTQHPNAHVQIQRPLPHPVDPGKHGSGWDVCPYEYIYSVNSHNRARKAGYVRLARARAKELSESRNAIKRVA